MALLIRRSKIHADGCYTTASIKKGMRIIEYTGPKLAKDAADDLYEDSPRTYLFGFGDGSRVIDGDGMAAFINHSCAPNCEPDEIGDRVYIFARRNIRAGEELAYDYNLYDGDLGDPARCFCGSKQCRGSLYSEEELAKRAREKKKLKKKK